MISLLKKKKNNKKNRLLIIIRLEIADRFNFNQKTKPKLIKINNTPNILKLIATSKSKIRKQKW